MKIRSLKQVLHWLFLSVGIISVIMLAFSVLTYIDYAREGYGLRADVTEAWLNEGRLVLRLRVENPGGMDLVLGPMANLSMSQVTSTNIHGGLVRAGNTTDIIVSFYLDQTELQSLRDSGMASFVLDIDITVSERDARTNLRLEIEDMEVRV